MNIASMKWLPLTLAALHGSLVVIVFSAAYIDPERHGLAPVVLLFSDLLFSMLLESIRKALHDDFGYGQRLVIDASVYFLFGSCWFYAIGWIIRKAVARLRTST